MIHEGLAPAMGEIVAAAERALAARWGRAVRLGEPVRQRGTFSRSTVVRCPVLDGPAGAPPTVIVKCFRGDRPTEEREWPPERRLHGEWAAYEFLNGLPGEAPASGRLHAGDAAAGLLVLEDLGDGPCLADLLLGDDPARAEAALLAYAVGVGRLHAASAARIDALDRARAAHGLPRDDGQAERLLAEQVDRCWAAAAVVGVVPPAAATAEVARVMARVREPGRWRAFSPGDTCPNNHRLTPTGPRFFDFEFSGANHALLDGVYPRVPFPTCIHVGRLPVGLAARASMIYRAELVRGCPPAADDAIWGEAVTLAHAYWMLVTLGWHLGEALEQDGQWGSATLRQRHLLRLDTFAAACAEFDQLPALAATARTLARRLRERWPPEAEMPLYPAFRGEV